jgi:hypothetical protein
MRTKKDNVKLLSAAMNEERRYYCTSIFTAGSMSIFTAGFACSGKISAVKIPIFTIDF